MLSESELFRVRVAMIQSVLRNESLEAVLITRPGNYAMATGGKRNYVNFATDAGANGLVVTKEGKASFIGDNVEAARQMQEELAGLDCDEYSDLWFEGSVADIIAKEFSGAIASDDGSVGPNIHGKLNMCRAMLTTTELEKYRRLGAIAADCMMATLESIKKGTSEREIAAKLVYEGRKRGCLVPVALIAADDRIAKYRHPLPVIPSIITGGAEDKVVNRYVMIAGGFYREGLTVSITRFRQVDELPDDIRDAHARICAVDAVLQESTQPGRRLSEIFADCQKAYSELGFPEDEWRRHHQGGPTGYAGRTAKARPTESFRVLEEGWSEKVNDICGIDVPFGQAYAWNPSAVGVKSEDTFILYPDGSKEIVSATPFLPRIDLAAVLGRETDVAKSEWSS